ncbi:MAG TPA: ABC transporter permease [Candidatus Paceibacterota bacterium]|nr:ABC transporter permease [Candidatus Paceibacterota bacterium]
MKFLPLIWNGLFRKKTRTILTLLSILVAFLLFGYLSAIEEAFNAGVSMAGADRLIVRHRVTIVQTLPVSYQQRIAQIPGIEAVTHATWFNGLYQDSARNFFPQMPVVPEEFLKVYPEFILTEAEKNAWLKTRTGAIAGRQLAKKYGWKVGDRIPLQATIWRQEGDKRTWEYDLVGIYDGAKKGTDTTQFFFRYDYFDEARAFGKGEVGWYIIKIKDPEQSTAIARRIDDEFANSPAETKAEAEGAFVSGFAKQIGDIQAIMISIMSAVFFTILLVVGNTMSQAVHERTEELGVLKALGFSNPQLLCLILIEALVLSGLGGGLGLLFAVLMTAMGDPTRGVLPMFYLPTGDLWIGAGLAVGLGIFTGLFPAWRAMRMNIAEALRRM